MRQNEEFDKWYLETWGSPSEDSDESNKAFYAWEACKKEVLEILDKYNHTSSYKYIKEEIQKL